AFIFPLIGIYPLQKITLHDYNSDIYICIIRDAVNKCINFKLLGYAILSVIGALVVRYDKINSHFIIGLVLIQSANFVLAIGQYSYSLLKKNTLKQSESFFAFYLGATLVSGAAYALLGERPSPTPEQWALIAYLGFIASGLGWFLWNKGTTKVSTTVFAIMNHGIIPAGIIINVLLFNGHADFPRLVVGGAIMAWSVYLSSKEEGKEALKGKIMQEKAV
ncbi:MAG: EamA family transporter, partial [Endozoicomonas sp. (ex Botrylloides leachii)]|nr:EamA family transporter [Endozoicomonas sp. (ex Botrylloides leachii)]